MARELTERGKTPLFVGGTGLYIDSVGRCNAQDAPESDPEYRDKILEELKTDEDITALWERLRTVDPESAEKIHKNNVRRVIRALEIYEKTGKPKSQLDRESLMGEREVFVGMLTLDFHNRELLYDRVDKRVDIMMEEGLLDEVKSLYSRGLLSSGTAAAAIGYKELVEHLEGRCSLSEAVEAIKLASRRYAKRQLTWFRHEKDAVVIYADTTDGKMRDSEDILREALRVADEMRRKYENLKGDRANES